MQGPMSPSTSVQKRGRIHKCTLKFRTQLTFSWSGAKGICFSPMLRGQVEGAGHNNASILKNDRPAPKELFYPLHPKMKMKQRDVGPKEPGLTKPTHSSANSQVNRRQDKAAKCFHWSPHHSHRTKQVQIPRFPQLTDRANCCLLGFFFTKLLIK